MQHDAAAANPPMPRTRVTASQLAWVVLLGAFLVFCVLCGLTAYGINYFLFQSTVPMQVGIDVGRGTAAYLLSSDPDENVAPQTGHYLFNNERIRVDGLSQATLLIRDTLVDNRLIASITMSGANGSTAYLGHAQRPRFQWSSVEYRIDLTQASGDFDVYVPAGLDRALLLRLAGTNGAHAYITESGHYSLTISPDRLEVFNRDGRAVLVPPNYVDARLVNPGERAHLTLGPDGVQSVSDPGPLNLLPPAQLQTMDAEAIRAADVLLPDLVWPWQCGDSQAEPPGSYTVGLPDGRPGIRLLRDQGATSHGETGCSQSPGPSQTGRDVRDFSSLVFKASLYIDGHSLPFCGQQGSECPLMLQLDYKYVDGEGQERLNQWFHGFYARTDPNASWPTRCSSCLVDHDAIYPGAWFTYESPNLLTLIPAEQRPVSLLRVRFYASGHEYDVYIGDMGLYAS